MAHIKLTRKQLNRFRSKLIKSALAGQEVIVARKLSEMASLGAFRPPTLLRLVGIKPSKGVCKAVMMMFLRLKKPEKAANFWQTLQQDAFKKDEVLWNLYLTAKLQARHSKEFIQEILQQMAQEDIQVLPWSMQSVQEYRDWLGKDKQDLIKLLAP